MTTENNKNMLLSKEIGIKAGDIVQSFVFYGTERVKMHTGIVVKVRDGSCDVDRMGLHGGEPWIVTESMGNLEKLSNTGGV